MQTVRRVSTFEATVEVLQEQVSSGRWPVGQRIPSESQLTAQLGVSRASLREAVRSLVHAGVLQSRQGDGTYVVSVSGADAALQRHLAGAHVKDVAEVRRGLDVVAAGLAASRRTQADLDALESAITARSAAAAVQDEDAFVEADIAFHGAVVRAAHNPVLDELYQSFVKALTDAIRGGQCMAVSASGLDPHHDRLLQALRRQDAAAATSSTNDLLNMTSRDH